MNRMVFFFNVAMVLFTSCAERGVVIRERIDELPVVAERVLIDGDTVIVCHPEMLTDSIALPLSHFVEDLEIVPLETSDEAYVRSTGVSVTDNYFLLHSSRNMPFKLFTRDGKFVCNIGSSGNGHGNYGQVYDVHMDEKHSRIYIMPWSARELIVYDTQGQFQGYIPLNQPGEQMITYGKPVFRVDGERKEITVASIPWKRNQHIVWVQDFKGNVLCELTNNPFQVSDTYSVETYSRQNTCAFDFSVLEYYPQRNDTLYHYVKESNILQPVFTMSFPEDRILPHSYLEHPTCFLVTTMDGMQESGLESTITYGHNEYIIDKRTLRGGKYSVYNDFLGGTSTYWLKHSSGGYYVRNLSPQTLKAELQEALGKDNLTPSLRKKLSTLVESIDVDRDNNYLMLGRLLRFYP
ncbi:MAG: 6-bladed beta-propeller [Prevotella sp.]|nr:6-bladed beta-propeller [Prevotella sp.]